MERKNIRYPSITKLLRAYVYIMEIIECVKENPLQQSLFLTIGDNASIGVKIDC